MRIEAPSPLRRLPSGLRHLAARPRLATALAVFVAVAIVAAMFGSLHWPSIVLLAWNAAVGLLLTLDLVMMASSDERTMRRRAALLDDGQEVILALSVLAAIASLAAIVFELAVVKDLSGLERAAHVGLAAVTVATAWAFTHVMFAIHYAHEYVLGRDTAAGPGLRIPGEERPDYWDFLYVAIVIGTSGQTADVEFTSKPMRRIGLLHCTLAFFFNTTVLALTINIAAGLM
jgi:uncharacterized membrane protein